MKKDFGLYSKEVMKHFQHPKNMGTIKNPSGIGKVGNKICGDIMWLYIKVKKDKKGKDKISDVKFQTFGCLPPNEKVLINEGEWENIVNVSKENVVLNSDGKKTVIMKTFVRNYKGILLTFVPFVSPFNKFSVTPEHPILCIKRKNLKSTRKPNKKCDWLRVNRKELLTTPPEFVRAVDIEEGDYLIFVPNFETKDYVSFTKELMKLLGYYLSEGYITAKESVLTFSLNKNEKENIEELKDLLFKITKKKPKYRTRRNAIEIYICSRKWVNFFVSKCGKLARHKRLSKEVLLLPFEKQWKMIRTYIKGDGNLYKRRNKDSPTYRVTTASKKLAIQIQEILAKGDIFSSIKEVKRTGRDVIIEGRKVNAHNLFEISFKLKRKHRFVHKNKKYLLIPIRRIEKRYYEGKVYNLHVKGHPESYLIKGFAVHNCVAAIATSSMITKLAKGKTIEEALKITKLQVANTLGGLPKIKLHCSVLASDALNEAIYNYLSKNKLKIPEELKKRHQMIKQETKMIEEKYKSYISMEKKIWGVNEK